MLHDGVEELVAVEDRAVGIRHREAVAVAVEGDAEVRAMLGDGASQRRGMGRAATLVDVEAVGGAPDRDHLGAELLEDARADAIVGAVGAIDDELEAPQRVLLGKRALAEFEVAALGVVHALGLAEVLRRLHYQGSVEERLDLALHGVRQLHAVRREELDAVVLERIVRGGDHHARGKPQRAREERDRGSGHRSHEERIDARRGESRLERGLEHVARDARVLADQHRRARAMRLRDVRTRQHLARGVSQLQHEVGRDGRLAHAPANAVGAEVSPAHRESSIQVFSASTVSFTSCTRTMLAPFCAARTAAATLPELRSSIARPVRSPIMRLRETPTTSG